MGLRESCKLKKLINGSGDNPIALVPSRNSILYISLHSVLLKGFKIRITELDKSTGKQIGQPTLITDSEVPSEESILYMGSQSGTGFLVWTDKALRSIKIGAIGTKQVTTLNVVPKNGDSIERIVVHAARTAAAHAQFLVHYQGAESHWAEVYHIDPSTSVAKKAYDLPRLGGKGAFSVSTQGSESYFIRHTAFEVTLVSSVDSTVLGHWNVRPKSHGGLIEPQEVSHAVSEVVSRGGSKYSLRSAVVLPSGDWELIRNGDLLWVRPEGLAGVIAAGYVEITKGEEGLAQELAAEGHSSVLGAYIHRIRRHTRDLQHFPSWAEALPARFLSNFPGDKDSPQEQSLRRDSFGFNKIVIVATENGRLAALDTGNHGNVIWNIQAVSLQAGQQWEVVSIDAEDGSALVQGKGGEFLRVVSSTGTILQYQPGAMIASLKTSVPVIDAQGQKTLIPVNVDGSISETPKADFADGIVVVTEGEDGIVRGWALKNKTKPILAWQFMPASGEKIHHVTPRPAHDPVASIGKALGDRNVLYKYLNPNTLLITTIAVKSSSAAFYIVDSTSGAVLHSTSHAGVDTSQPISSTISENWFAYSLFSKSTIVTQDPSQIAQQQFNKGYQLVTSELYESPYPNDRGPLGSSSNYSSISPNVIEEYDNINTPHVISLTYLLPGPISHMSVTSTLQGITPRSLLCVVPHLNALIAIPRHFLDPRRPVGRDPTPAEMEEGLFRHNPVLEFEPRWTLSHKRDIMNISDVVTSPSLLESTSLVLAIGDVDIFGTRTSPIGSFDMLGKGFSKVQLVLTVFALALGTSFVAPLVSPFHRVPRNLSCLFADNLGRSGESRSMGGGRLDGML